MKKYLIFAAALLIISTGILNFQVPAASADNPTVPTTLEAENMPTKTTGGSATDGWNIWSNGYIEQAVNFPSTATYQFVVTARGDYAGGAWPNAELRINQVVVASFVVDSSSWKTFT